MGSVRVRTLKPKLIVVAVLWGVLAMDARAADEDRTTPKVDAIFDDFKSSDAPGLAVLVVKDGKKVFERGYGVSDLRTKEKIGAETNFRLASVSKEFTATAIMLLVHDHKLSYSDRLNDIFPGFPKYGKAITIEQLLTHTSGLLDYEDLMAKQFGNIPDEQIPQIKDAGVLELLKKSMEAAESTISGYNNKLDQGMYRFDGKPTSKNDFLTFAVGHEMYHRGQLTVYERLLNIEPVLTGRLKRLFGEGPA